MTDLLKQKIEHSIELLKKAEKLALRYDPDEGFFLAFSGGKDSQALYHIVEMAGVKFKAHFSPTTVDPPQLIRFIRRNYPRCRVRKGKEEHLPSCSRKADSSFNENKMVLCRIQGECGCRKGYADWYPSRGICKTI